MSVSELSTSSQNYLKAVWGLQEWSEDPITPTAVAEKAGVRLSTASDAIRKLTEQGLLGHTPYGAVTLTSQGRAHAVAMVRRHRLIETFLVQVLGYTWDEVHDEAEHLEHAVSDRLIARMDEMLGYPSVDPHGDPIPGADGDVPDHSYPSLAECPVNVPLRVVRVADQDAAFLRFIEERGLKPGQEVRVVEREASADAVVLRTRDGREITLGSRAASKVLVDARRPG